MATRPISTEQMLAAIPSLPRPMLARLVDHMIDRLDELDGDPDLEENGDREAVDERECDEEPRQFQMPPTARTPALTGHYADPIPATWRLSISTRTALLEVMRGN